MELSSHARSVIQDDIEHLRTEELEQKLKDTRMAFDRDDLAAVKSALGAAKISNATEHVAGQADIGEKQGLARHTKAAWRRRKRSKGSDEYRSLAAQYESV